MRRRTTSSTGVCASGSAGRKVGCIRGRATYLLAITEHDEACYLLAQTEALAWLEWHKKCCRAAFPKGEGDAE